MAEPDYSYPEHKTITLTLDDDSTVTCMVLAVIPLNQKKYIALLPLGSDGEPDPEAGTYVYQFIDHGPDEDPELKSIESDAEFKAVSDAFASME